jgi:hypothetical protein
MVWLYTKSNLLYVTLSVAKGLSGRGLLRDSSLLCSQNDFWGKTARFALCGYKG